MTLYRGSRSDAAAGRSRWADRFQGSAAFDFVAAQNLFFSASKYNSVNGLMIFFILIYFDINFFYSEGKIIQCFTGLKAFPDLNASN